MGNLDSKGLGPERPFRIASMAFVLTLFVGLSLSRPIAESSLFSGLPEGQGALLPRGQCGKSNGRGDRENAHDPMAGTRTRGPGISGRHTQSGL